MAARTAEPKSSVNSRHSVTNVASQNSFFTKGTPRSVAVCVSASAQSTHEAIRQSVEQGADIVEVNIAQMPDSEIAQLNLPNDVPSYVVCRRRQFMSVYGLRPASLPKRDDNRRMSLCLKLLQQGARAIDIECDTFSDGRNEVPKSLPADLLEFTVGRKAVDAQQDVIRRCREAGASVILSCHAGRLLDPKQAIALSRLMAERGADLIKIVTKHSDEREIPGLIQAIAETAQRASVPIMLISMGPRSALMRVVGSYVGNAGIFCRAEGPSANFSGHPSLSTMKAIWKLLPYSKV